MYREWHDYIENHITMELDEPPETNIQMANDILYAYEHHPEVLTHLIQDMLYTANESVMHHLEQFMIDFKELSLALEFRNIQMNHYGSVIIEFTPVSGDVVRVWTDTDPLNQGGIYALI